MMRRIFLCHLLLLLPKKNVFCFLLSSTTRDRSNLSRRQAEESYDAVIQLPLWEAQLQEAENSDDREELERKIENAKTSCEFGLRRAQVEFYDAFSNQDMNKMGNVWASRQLVQCIHPGMSSIVGRDALMKSWEILFQSEAFSIEPSNTKLDVCGSTAICKCVENVGQSRLETLNIYKREDGEWKMTLHIASAIAVMDSGSI